MYDKIRVFSGNSNPNLAQKICDVLGFNRSNVYYTEKPRKKHEKTAEAWLVDEVHKLIEEFP